MNPAPILWLALVGLLAYALAVEPLFFDYLMIQVLRLTVFFHRCWVMFLIHPDSPWVQYQLTRNSNRIATKLLNEINERTNGKSDDDDNAGRPPVA
jgi:hypothetical protein